LADPVYTRELTELPESLVSWGRQQAASYLLITDSACGTFSVHLFLLPSLLNRPPSASNIVPRSKTYLPLSVIPHVQYIDCDYYSHLRSVLYSFRRQDFALAYFAPLNCFMDLFLVSYAPNIIVADCL